MNKKPMVSILMPVYNAGRFLVPAIESIQAQTYPYFELLCIDDGSTDGSLETMKTLALKDKRVKVLSNKSPNGIGYCLNKGLEKVQGDYIARMDADDISLPKRLEAQLKYLQENPSVVACGGQADMIDSDGAIFAYKRFPTESKTLYKMIMRMVPIQHPMLFARAYAFKNYRYSEVLTTAEDVDMLFYLLSKGKLGNVKDFIYQYRKTNTSNGYHNIKNTFYITFASRFEAIKKYGYIPTLSGIAVSLLQLLIVGMLPSKLVVKIFEAFRFEPPLWKRPIHLFSPVVIKRLAQARV